MKGGETISSTDLSVFCGGKGLNQSVAAARAGASVFHAGMIGKDGEILKKELIASGVDVRYLRQSEGVSGHAIIQVDSGGQNSIIINAGANALISEEYIDETMGLIEEGDIVLTQNEISNISYIIKSAHDKGACIAFNPSPVTSEIVEYPLDFVDILILNEIEGSVICNCSNADEILNHLERRFPNAELVLTLGEEGAWHSKNGIRLHQEIFKVPVVDTTAAGDTFTGYFIAGRIMGLNAQKSIERASLASSITVSRRGAAQSIPLLGELY